MAEATLGLGGNIGDVGATIARALDRLGERGVRVLRRSADYRTPPWGRTDQPPFVNAAAVVATDLSPEALLDACLAVEGELGRVRIERWGPRTIDIDVLTYGNERRASPRLTLPHPLMLERGFVLVPLAEIAPDLEVGGAKIAAHAARFAGEPIKPMLR